MSLMIGLFFTSCEGLDDWSDLKAIELFNNKAENSKSGTFRRYEKPGVSSQPVIQSIYDPSSKFSKSYNEHIRKVCDYTKLPFYCMTTTSWNASLKIAPTTRVIMIYDTKKLNDASIEVLLNFVAKGGTLFLPFASEDKRMGFLLGFKPEAEYGTDVKAAGLYFNTPFFPNMKGKSILTDTKLFGFSGQNFSKKVKILATAANNLSCPTIVENSIGEGKVILYNTSGDFSKADRGLLFAGILKGLEGIPYPIANASTIFLDDFPSPQYDIIAEPIKSEMNITTSDYVQKVWWPDMRELAKEFKIPYAAMLTFDYRNKIYPPFTLDQWNLKKISTKVKSKDKVESLPDWLVNDVKKNGHELAFHGYNHVSLLKKLWKNPKFIETSMGTVKKKWKLSDYGNLPVTYVPPSNDIDRMGLRELQKSMPSIKYMCSLYIGILEDGGDREFDYDPFEPNFFDFPRISSGFYMSNDEKYTIESMYLYTGIWTHFVHPDDVYQIPATADKRAAGYSLRNQHTLGWRKTKNSDKALLPEFRSYIKQLTTAYPQLRFVDGGVGGDLTMNWRASRFSHKSEKGLYTVQEIKSQDSGKKYWFMYSSPTNAEKIESQLRSQSVLFGKTPIMDGYLYSVYTNKSKLISVDVLYKAPKEKAKEIAIMNMVKADFAKFKLDVKEFLSGGDWSADYEKKLKLEMEALKNKLLSNPEINAKDWNTYADYMASINKGGEMWKLYEDYVSKNNSKNNIMYSQELDKIIEYKDEIAMEKWMSEQIKVSPNDKKLLKTYIESFDKEEYRDKIKNALKALNKVEPSPENYKKYLRHLLEYYPEEALVELENKQPTKELADLANAIVWLFADNAEYAKAIAWSEFSSDIDFVTKMNWYISAGLVEQLEPVYNKYIIEHPEDEIATVLMSGVYHEQGRFKDAWVLANSISEIYEKEELRKTLNTDVVYESMELQQDLIANHAELFYPDVLKKLMKDIRLAKGNYVELTSYVETNQADPSFQRNLLSYNMYDKKGFIHGLGVSFGQYYELLVTKKKYEDNVDNRTMGVEYRITSPEKENKPQYWSRARIEVDKETNPYFQFGAGISKGKERNFNSAELNVFPIETAPALNQKIYQAQLNLYKDFYVSKSINTSISIEGNYYTEGLLARDTIGPPINPNRLISPSLQNRKVITDIGNGFSQVDDIDDGYDAAVTLRALWDNGKIKKHKFVPFLESQAAIGSRDLSVGYPYWIIKERIYGGGGLAWEFNATSFTSRIEGGYFFDTFAGDFQRVTAQLSYQIFDFTALTFSAEVFQQSKFYSNALQFGFKHNFKKKYIKRKK